MGRHARGASRSRVPVATIVGSLLVLVIAVGSWLGSRAQPAPNAGALDASAVVVSSLACTDGAHGTVVDVLGPTGWPAGSVVRATLDGCGYQEGQRLAVQFLPGDPTQVTLAGTDDAGDGVTGGRLLPFGLAVVALLAVGALLAVWLDSRRARRHLGGARDVAAHGLVDPEEGAAPTDLFETFPPDEPLTWAQPAGATLPGQAMPTVAAPAEPAATLVPAGTTVGTTVGTTLVQPAAAALAPRGRHARPEPEPAADQLADTGRHGPLSVLEVLHASSPARPSPFESLARFAFDDRDADPDPRSTLELSSVDLVFPYSSSLAASLHDELFTHRSSATS